MDVGGAAAAGIATTGAATTGFAGAGAPKGLPDASIVTVFTDLGIGNPLSDGGVTCAEAAVPVIIAVVWSPVSGIIRAILIGGWPGV